MREAEIFNQLRNTAVLETTVGFVKVAIIPKPKFDEFIHYFNEDKFQKGEYRSHSYLKHLHATPVDEGYFNLHWDLGNPNIEPFLSSLIHLCRDVIPYYAVIIRKLGYFKLEPTLEEFKIISSHAKKL